MKNHFMEMLNKDIIIIIIIIIIIVIIIQSKDKTRSRLYDILVIVKKSSPKNLSADSWPTVGRQLTDSRPTGFLGSSSSQLPTFLCISYHT